MCTQHASNSNPVISCSVSPDGGKHHGGGDLARLLLTYQPKISYELAGFHLLAHVPPRFSLQSIKEGNAVLECLYDHGIMHNDRTRR